MYERFRTSLSRRVAFLIATGGGAGLLRIAPGTWGSLVGVLAVIALAEANLSTRLIVWSGLALVGVWATAVFQRASGRKDPGEIVIDEVLGMGIVSLFCVNALELPFAFVLFRFFDIVKVFPANCADRLSKRTEGWVSAIAVQLDDGVAALQAAGVLWFLREHTRILTLLS